MSYKILICDDNESQLGLVSGRLKNRGFEVISELESPKILDHLKEGGIDLLLLDLEMPLRSGYDIIKEVRQDFDRFDLPIIVMTASEELDALSRCLEIGASDFITKPINMNVLISRMNTQIDLSKHHQEQLKRTELETLQAMIITYQHQINNPLAIAVGALELYRRNQKPDYIVTVTEALDRINTIVRKIKDLTENPLVKESYSRSAKMFKVS